MGEGAEERAEARFFSRMKGEVEGGCDAEKVNAYDCRGETATTIECVEIGRRGEEGRCGAIQRLQEREGERKEQRIESVGSGQQLLDAPAISTNAQRRGASKSCRQTC